MADMQSSRNILLVVEGKKAEPALFSRTFEAFGLQERYHIVSIGMNVYAFFEYLEKHYGDSLEFLEMQTVLLEFFRSIERDSHSLSQIEQELRRRFTDILIVFDFDPQDNRFDADLLTRLQENFCDSSDMGQLYINYPMLEAYRDFERLGDSDFYESEASYEEICHKGTYKHRVHARKNGIPDVGNLGGMEIAAIVAMHVSKAQHLLDEMPESDVVFFARDRRLSDCAAVFSHADMLQFELEALKRGSIYPMCTCLMFLAAWPRQLDGAWNRYCRL